MTVTSDAIRRQHTLALARAQAAEALVEKTRESLRLRQSELLDHADESDGTGEHVGFARHYRAKAEGIAEAIKLLDAAREEGTA